MIAYFLISCLDNSQFIQCTLMIAMPAYEITTCFIYTVYCLDYKTSRFIFFPLLSVLEQCLVGRMKILGVNLELILLFIPPLLQVAIIRTFLHSCIKRGS